MPQDGFSFLAYAVAWATVTTGAWYLFERAEKTASNEGKAIASRWLKNLAPESAVQSWPATFASTFDRIFGDRHVSWKCFRRSCMASTVAAFIMALVINAVNRNFVKDIVKDILDEMSKSLLRAVPGVEASISWNLGFVGLFVIIAFLLLSVILNWLPDYLSLLESRYVITWMSNADSFVKLAVLLLVDLVATAVIWSVCLVPLLLVFDSPLSVLHDVLRGGVFFWKGEEAVYRVFGIWFYSTFFTSVWVWLYALAGFAVKLGEVLGLWVGRFKRIMDIHEKPFSSMGYAAMVIVTLGFLGGLPLLLLR